MVTIDRAMFVWLIWLSVLIGWLIGWTCGYFVFGRSPKGPTFS
jgi:hypothetical protein